MALQHFPTFFQHSYSCSIQEKRTMKFWTHRPTGRLEMEKESDKNLGLNLFRLSGLVSKQPKITKKYQRLNLQAVMGCAICVWCLCVHFEDRRRFGRPPSRPPSPVLLPTNGLVSASIKDIKNIKTLFKTNHIAVICHQRHQRRWCTLFQLAYFFP